MRICFIDAAVGTITGGAETFMYNLCLELSKKHEIFMLTGSTPCADILPHIKAGPFKLSTVPYISRLDRENEVIRSRLRLPSQFDFEAVSFFLNFLKNRKAKRFVAGCDIASLHYPMTSILFSWYLKAKGMPSIFQAHGPVVIKSLFKLNRCSKYLTENQYTDEKICETTGIRADGIVSPGIHKPKIIPRDFSEISSPILLSVCRLTRSKGVYRILEIFRCIKKEIPGAKLLLVGKNYEGEGIIEKAKELGVQRDINLVGEVSYFEVQKYYDKADILIHPAYPENFGIVLLEAMSFGLPIVTTDLPSLRMTTRGCAMHLPYEKGYDWQADLYQMWAKEIISLLRNTGKRKEMSEKGRDISFGHTWDKKAEQYEGFFKEAMRSAKRK